MTVFSPSFAYPYYDGVRLLSTATVPGKYPVALAGHAYLLDNATGFHRHVSIPLLRPQSDTSGLPGESSLNPEGTWRRAQDSWHKGAGQVYVDKPESDSARFRSSKGIDVWDKWEMKLLPATKSIRASTSTNLRAVVAGSRLYIVDGTSVLYSSDITVSVPTFSAVTGLPISAPISITSDGHNILIACGAGGLYHTTKSLSNATLYCPDTVSLASYVKDRIMLASGSSIYNLTHAYETSSSLPTPLFTHRNPDFRWVGFAGGQQFIYAAGYSGDKSVIYKTQVQAEGDDLEVPIVAGELPDGEIIRAISSYLSYILLGTDLGVRFCGVDDGGNLVIGSLIRTNSSVRSFEPQDRFVWFGWTNYDGTSTGLGRLDLTIFNSPLTPAYASDLMASGQGSVESIVTFQSRRVFAASSLGFLVEDTDRKVESGILNTGLFTFGTPDPKTAIKLDIRYKTLAGTHTAYVSGSDGVFLPVGQHSSLTSTDEFSVPEIRSDALEIRHVLTRDATLTSLSAIIARHTLKATVSADTGYRIYAPLLLVDKEDHGQETVYRNPLAELLYIKSLRENQTRVPWQEGDNVYLVTVDDYDWRPTHMPEQASKFNGTCLTTLRVVTE